MPRVRPTVTPLEDRSTPAATLPTGFTETLLADGLNRPSALAAAPDGRVFVAEQTGAVRVVAGGTLLADPFASVAVDPSVDGFRSHSGLIGITLDPQFRSNGYLYVFYTAPGANGAAPFNRISRFTATGNTAAGGETVLVDLDPLPNPTGEQGGTMAFGPDGKLYVGTGYDAADATAQSLSSRLGKILRYNPDGTIPADNPTAFDGLSGTTAGANRAIWAVGLRQPYSMSFSPVTGQLFVPDVGNRSFEEVNLGRAGANYGWPLVEGPFDSAQFPAFTQPILAYPHGDGTAAGHAVTGGSFYQPPATAPSFPAEYVGDYFYLDFENGWINRRDAATGAVSNFATDLSGPLPTGLTTAANGSLLYLSFGGPPGAGAVYSIRFTPPAAPKVTVGALDGPVVKIADVAARAVTFTGHAFEPGYTFGVRVATGDVTGDRVDDSILGAGEGGGPRVMVLDGATGEVVYDFFAFDPAFRGGVHVAAGDMDRDGFADIVVTPGVGGGPVVAIFSGKDGSLLTSFLGIPDADFRGGATVGIGDGGGDGFLDLGVGAGPGGGPRLVIYDGRPGAGFPWRGTPAAPVRDYFAFDPTFRGGLYASAGDMTGDGRGDLVVGAGPGGGPVVAVFDGAALVSGAPIESTRFASFLTNAPESRGGNSVTVRDLDGDGIAGVLVGSGPGAVPRATVWQVVGPRGVQVFELGFQDPAFFDGVYVG